MQFVVFLIFYPLIWLISILPFRALYFLSDCFYILIYRIIGYRKKTVRSNLALAFPDSSKEDRLIIEKKFYHHLCDIFLEMTKTLTISEKEMDRRFSFTNLDLYKKVEKENKSIALLMAHYGSYEWAVSMNKHLDFIGFAIYKKIANEHFDKLVKDIRARFKAVLITTKETIPTIQKNEDEGIRGVYGFASDQSPKSSKAHHWGSFMGIETPVHTGAEMLAKRFDMNVMFLKTSKVKRGFYEGTFEILSLDARSVPDYELTDEFLRRVEMQIRTAPEFYLWTHKRWKHTRESSAS